MGEIFSSSGSLVSCWCPLAVTSLSTGWPSSSYIVGSQSSRRQSPAASKCSLFCPAVFGIVPPRSHIRPPSRNRHRRGSAAPGPPSIGQGYAPQVQSSRASDLLLEDDQGAADACVGSDQRLV